MYVCMYLFATRLNNIKKKKKNYKNVIFLGMFFFSMFGELILGFMEYNRLC